MDNVRVMHRLLVQMPCRYMAWFYSPAGERMGVVWQVNRGVFAVLMPATAGGLILGLLVAATAAVSVSEGAALGGMAGVLLGAVFVAYAHVLVYALGFRGRDWRAM